MPVVSYGTGIQAEDSWLAKLVCGASMVNGAIDVGHTAAKSMNSVAFGVGTQWTDLPIAICGFALMLFGATGLFRLRRSRFAICFLSGISVALNWIGIWLLIAPLMKMSTSQDRAVVAIESVYGLQSAVSPGFVIACLQHQSVREYFGRRNRF